LTLSLPAQFGDKGHRPVLLNEALQWLRLLDPDTGSPRLSDGWWLDATLGGGGHTEAILNALTPEGRVLGLDRDHEILDRTRERLAKDAGRLLLVHANFREMATVAREHQLPPFRGILLDLGISSFHVDEADRGFAFSRTGPLDMRMDRQQDLTAAEIVNHSDEEELARIFYEYGEEHRSRRLARWIVKHRPVLDTAHLATLARQALGSGGKIHPATRMFQALRIAVNDELGSLSQGLEAATGLLAPGGRLVIISFHSLEDRIVKQTLRSGPLEILTKHVIRPGDEETGANPRARSARLRAAQKRDESELNRR
jgi:16S rRNA (cytosine1402-N4)-methyltransferase